MTLTIKYIFSYKPFKQANKGNKIYLNLFLILLFSVNKINSQVTKFYFQDSTISSEGVLIDGKPDGYWNTYYENSNLKSEGNRKNFLLDSTWKFYYLNGRINKVINYKESKKDGVFILFNKNGTVIEKTNYKNNYKNGFSEIYSVTETDDSVFIREKNNYLNGVLDAFCYEFDSLNNVITIKKFNKGMLLFKEQINRYDDQLKKHGKWKNFHTNGKVKWEGAYVHGKLEGKIKEYNTKGGIKNIDSYTNGQPTLEKEPILFKLNKQINADGSIVEGMVINNKKEGTFRVYDKDGLLLVCNNYKNNIKLSSGLVDSLNFKIGKWEYFYKNGKIKAIGNYVKDIQDGLWFYYFFNDSIQQKGNYKLGKPEGEWLWWYNNGELHRKENFVKGKESGEIIEYDTVGNIITNGLYLEGKKEGSWYYFINDFKEEGSFVDDLKNGEWKSTYSNGKLSFEGKYINGIPIEKHTTYHSNGKVKHTGSYSNGKKNGEWKKYNYEGEVILTIVYKNGQEFKIDGIKVKRKK